MKIIQSVLVKRFLLALVILISSIPICVNASNGWTEQYNSGKLEWVDVAISQDGTKIIAAPTNNYLKYSNDRGLTWSSLETAGTRNWSDVASSYDGSVLAATVSGGYIYVSTNSGTTWTEYSGAGAKNWDNIVVSSDGTKMVATISNGVSYTSTNSGTSWTANTFNPGATWNEISMSANGEVLVAAIYNKNIYISTDLGANWVEKTTSGTLGWRGIAVSGDGTKILAAAASNYLYISTDLGNTWDQQTVAGLKSWQGVSLTYDGNKMAAIASNSYVYMTSDTGTPWQSQTAAGSRSWRNISYSQDGSILIASLYTENLFSYGEISQPVTLLVTPSATGENTIQLNGLANTSHTSHGFEYGLNASYGQTVSDTGTYELGNFSLQIDSITPDTIYHYRSFVTNEDGTSYSEDSTFKLNFQNYTRVNTSSISNIGSVASSSDGTKVAIISSSYIKTSTDSGVTFTNRMTSGISSWNGIASSSDGTKLIAAIASGGPEQAYIYTSSDSGVNWTPRSQAGTRNWRAVASSSDGTKLVAVVQGGNIYTSTNSGESWTSRENSRSWYTVSSSSDGVKLVAAVYGGYIYTSVDSGVTWIERTIPGSKNWSSVSISSDGSKIIATANNEYIYSSIDDGVTWQTLTQAGQAQWSGSNLNSDGTRITVTAKGTSVGYVISSFDGGLTWMRQATAGTREFMSVSSSLTGDKIYVGGPTGLYRYVEPTPLIVTTKTAISELPNSVTLNGSISNTDGRLATIRGFQYGTDTSYGTTVSDTGSYSDGSFSKNITITPGVTYHYRAFATNSLGTSYGSDQEINIAERHFIEQITSGVRNWSDVASSSDGVKLVAVDYGPDYGTTGKIYTSTDSGANWTERASSDIYKWYSIVSSSDGVKLLAGAYPGYLYTSTDSGTTWIERQGAGQAEWNSVASSSDGTKLIAAGSNGLYTSTDSGANWTLRSLNGNYADFVASSSDGTKLVAAVNNGYIYTSTDSGANWTERQEAGQRYWKEVTSSSDGSIIAIVDGIQNGSIYTSYDGGANWIERNGFPVSYYWHSIITSSDGQKIVAVGTENLSFGSAAGVMYASNDAGKSWTLVELPDTNIHSWLTVSSSLDGNTVFVGGPNTNIYTHTVIDVPIVITGEPSDVTDNSATLNAAIEDLKGDYPLSKGFMIGTDTNYGEVVEINEETSDREFSIYVSTLNEETTYHYRSFATNSIGTGLGEDRVFTTEAYVDQAPEITSFTIPSTSTSLQISITSFVATDDLGVTGYMITESSTTPLSSSDLWQASAPTTYEFSTEGNKTLYAWVKDESGNVSLSANDSILIQTSTSIEGYWTILGTPNFSDSDISYELISDIDSNNRPYVTIVYNDNYISVMKYDGSSWVNVGNPKFTKTNNYFDFQLDNDDVPYIIFLDHNNSYHVSVMKYTGQGDTGWEYVGNPGFISNSRDIKIRFDSDNIPYITANIQSNIDYSIKPTVMKYIDSQWVDVGTPRFTSSSVQYLSFTIDSNNVPYLAFNGWDGKVSVMKYTGQGDTGWEYVGNQEFSDAQSGISLAVDNDGIPYVSYLTQSQTLSVMKFDGNSWGYLGDQFLSTEQTEYPNLIVDRFNLPYIFYSEYIEPNYLKVKKYDGESWVNVGNEDIYENYSRYNSISIDSNNITYIFFTDTNTYQVTSMFLNTSPMITSYTGNFIESISEAGAVSGEKVINISGDTFVNAGGVLNEGTHYTLTNKPQGLNSSMSVDANGKIAILTFSNKATNHAKENSVNNLTIEFLDAAFTNTSAQEVLNYVDSNGSITFLSLNSSFSGTTKLYGANGTGETSGTELFELDIDTGDVIRTIGLTGHNINGMDFHPITGVLYGNTSNGDPDGGKPKSLFTINITTGAATWLGTIKDEGGVAKAFADITFKSDGTLYGFANDGGDWNYGLTNLYTISTNCVEGICLATRVSDYELNEWASGGGIAFDSNDNLYLFKSEDLGYVKLDPSTGSILETNAFLVSSPNDGYILAAKFDGNNNLFATRDDYSLVYINLTDKGLISLKESNPDMDAMTAIAFELTQNQEEPEEPEEPVQPIRRSSGTSVGSRYNFLINSGKLQEAENLKKEFPNVVNSQQSNPQQPSLININRTLKYGMIGEDVKELQKYLNNHGYPLTQLGPGSLNNETTFFGLKTKEAVIKFQKSKGLIADGMVGPITRSYLK